MDSIKFTLIPFPELSCVCYPVATERAYYDNLEQHSICDNKSKNASTAIKEPQVKCKLLFFNLTSIRQQSRNVKMYRIFDDEDNPSLPCHCDERTNVLYRQVYCIPLLLLKEYSGYGMSTISRTITENMKAIMFLCNTMKLRRECNYLANLCVILEYNLDKQSPCSFFHQAQINDYTSEATRRIKPNLFYKRGRNTIEDINKKLDQSYNIGLALNFTILEFSFRGDLLKFGRSNLKLLNLCAMQNGYVDIVFPNNIQQRCLVSLEETIENSKEMTFNSIFIQYHDGKTRLLKRIPVLIRNVFQNREVDSSKWQFLSRFYLVNTITGHRPGLVDNPYSERNMVKKFESVRYLKSAELRFEVKDRNKIETPVLVLEYGHVNLSQSTGNDFMYVFDFRVNFEKSMNFDTLLEILLPILLIIGLMLSVAETVSYKIREGKQFIDWDILLRFFVEFTSKIANTLFITAAGIAVYIHIVYKTQNTVKILMPDDIAREIKYFLVVALCLKTFKLAQHMHCVANIDIFFVDCERPKLGETVLLKNHLETPSSMGSRNINLENNVSAWRNYFIANEWLELTTKRPISVFLHTFGMLILLHLVGMQHFASTLFYFHVTKQPSEPPISTDIILKVSTGLICFLLSYTVQRLINYLVWERYVKNPIQQFIDVCSIANVSVFLFSHRCYGYYVHGRSPHGFADTDVCSMMMQFKREEDNLCGHRGLLPGSENQTYRVLAPKNLRAFYDKLVLPMHKPAFFSNFGQQSATAFQFERTSSTYQSINRFFMAFIDHVSSLCETMHSDVCVNVPSFSVAQRFGLRG